MRRKSSRLRWRRIDLGLDLRTPKRRVLCTKLDGERTVDLLVHEQPPATLAERTRCQTLADAIDSAAERVTNPRVLSLACGHLREAELARAVRARQLSDFYAVDQDKESLAEVERSYRRLGVTPVEYGVRDILKGGRPATNLDLAYTAGLYDYHSEDIAVRTTSALFDMVKPGGRVLIANFSPDLLDIEHMDACMDWWLIYRDETAMRSLFRGIPEGEIESLTIWKRELGSVVYAEAIRA
jgi:extracellular factor (EF) 3-hydroxypalmitic acid methyl ester biosynthesis protein